MKTWVLSLLLCLSVFVAEAQIGVGASGGFRGSRLYPAGLNGVKHLDAIPTGFFRGYIRIGRPVYFEPGIGYGSSGGELINTIDNQKFTVNLRAFEFPMLVGWRFLGKDNPVFSARIYGGPVFSAIVYRNVGGQRTPVLTESNIRNFNMSLLGGINFKLLIFTLGLEYEGGVTNLYKGNQDGSLKTGVFNLSFGLALGT